MSRSQLHTDYPQYATLDILDAKDKLGTPQASSSLRCALVTSVVCLGVVAHTFTGSPVPTVATWAPAAISAAPTSTAVHTTPALHRFKQTMPSLAAYSGLNQASVVAQTADSLSPMHYPSETRNPALATGVMGLIMMSIGGLLMYLRARQPTPTSTTATDSSSTTTALATHSTSQLSQEEHLAFAAFVISFGELQQNGTPNFWMPSPENGKRMKETTYNPTLPTMYYLPGIDGSGVAAQQQLPKLARNFNLWSLTVPINDRTSFADLVDFVVEFIEANAEKEKREGVVRPLYLLGESFGGCIALAVAAKCKRVNRVVLVNPATSFRATVWPTAGPVLTSTPEAVYPLFAALLAPILANPVNLALVGVDRTKNPFEQLGQLASNLATSIPAMRMLSEVLPPATLDHKLASLKEGSEYLSDGVLKGINCRVLAFGSEQDLLLPSADEVKRLSRKLPNAQAKVVPGRSHAMLQEDGVDLMRMMEDEGFYTRELVMSGKGPLGVEVPTKKETDVATERVGVDLLEKVLSPIFMSVNQEGVVQRGVGGVDWGDRPILIVANHQTLAPDLGLIITKLFRDEGVLARGLAHPTVIGGPQVPKESLQGSNGGEDAGGPASFGSVFRQFGAVPVTGRNMYDLLAGDEVALLFPGGVREAYKGKGEDYQLIWPNKPEFVRLAAKFGATIVPLSAIGADDGLEMLLDGKEILELPIIGDMVRKRADSIPAARATADEAMGVESFVSPVVLPKLTESRRYYFLFGKPIYTDCNMDRERCAEVYQETRDSVEAGINWLLERREEDPYQYVIPRATYELAWGKQAPTFPSLEGARLPWNDLTSNTDPLEEPELCAVDLDTPEKDEAEAEVVAPLTPEGELQAQDWYPSDA